MGQRFFKGSCKESSAMALEVEGETLFMARKIRTGVPLSRPRPASRLRDYTILSEFGVALQLKSRTNGDSEWVVHERLPMQRLIHNVLPPAMLGAVLAMVSIGVVDAVSLNKRLSLRPAGHQQPSVWRRQLPATRGCLVG